MDPEHKFDESLAEWEASKEKPNDLAEADEPTEQNPVVEANLGLYRVMGSYDRPTQVILRLKDGRELSLPWDKARDYLPAEYAEMADAASHARTFWRHLSMLETAIRATTDVMTTKGRVRSKVLGIVGKDTRAGTLLEQLDELQQNFDSFANKTYKKLQSSVRVHNLDSTQLKVILETQAKLEDRYFKLEEEVFKNPDAKKVYSQWVIESRLETPERLRLIE